MSRRRRSVLRVGWVIAAAACSSCSDDPSAPATAAPDAETVTDAGSDVDLEAGDAGPSSDADAAYSSVAIREVTCKVTPCIKEISGGGDHICALLSDGTVACWGNNTSGEVGDAREADAPLSDVPRPFVVPGLSNTTHLSTGGGLGGASPSGGTSCARAADGTVRCWGSNRRGQLGASPDADPHPLPELVAGAGGARNVRVGDGFVCALTSADLLCWGANDRVNLGRGIVPTPHELPGAAIVNAARLVDLALGIGGFARRSDQTVMSWGAGPTGRISSELQGLPEPIESLDGVTDVATASAMGDVAETAACAISFGRVFCWGSNRDSLLGRGFGDVEGTGVYKAGPAALPAELVFTQVSVGPRNACAVTSAGAVFCWGTSANALAGPPAEPPARGVSTPLLMTGFAGEIVRVEVFGDTACALLVDGRVQCWGKNHHGQLGRGEVDAPTTHHTVPATVSF